MKIQGPCGCNKTSTLPKVSVMTTLDYVVHTRNRLSTKFLQWYVHKYTYAKDNFGINFVSSVNSEPCFPHYRVLLSHNGVMRPAHPPTPALTFWPHDPEYISKVSLMYVSDCHEKTNVSTVEMDQSQNGTYHTPPTWVTCSFVSNSSTVISQNGTCGE